MGRGPFGIFPKKHPIWRIQTSLIVRCSITRTTKRSHPIHPSYSTTVLHASKMVFFFLTTMCHLGPVPPATQPTTARHGMSEQSATPGLLLQYQCKWKPLTQLAHVTRNTTIIWQSVLPTSPDVLVSPSTLSGQNLVPWSRFLGEYIRTTSPFELRCRPSLLGTASLSVQTQAMPEVHAPILTKASFSSIIFVVTHIQCQIWLK